MFALKARNIASAGLLACASFAINTQNQSHSSFYSIVTLADQRCAIWRVCAAPIEGNVEVGSVSLTPNYGVCLIVCYQSYTFTSGYTVLVDLD
jgi:hypothetical protein